MSNNDGFDYEGFQQIMDFLDKNQLFVSISEYGFQENNQYLNTEFPIQTALNLLHQGRNTEAILALEAHIQKYKGNENVWKVIGRLHQENDQDVQAVQAFLRALKESPNELDTLISLGVSCVNTLNEKEALSYLKCWLTKNPKYNIEIDDDLINEDMQIQNQIQDQVKSLNEKLIQAFEAAYLQGPNDLDLLNGLAVLYFIERNYAKAVEVFKKALQVDPKNYQIWNKLGATLTNLGDIDQGIVCYHKALKLRPNYVRAMVNLAIGHSSKTEYSEAVKYYFSALLVNPQAQHVWNYLYQVFTSMGRVELIEKIIDQDSILSNVEFNFIHPKDLEQYEQLYEEANIEYLFKMPEVEWLQNSQQML